MVWCTDESRLMPVYDTFDTRNINGLRKNEVGTTTTNSANVRTVISCRHHTQCRIKASIGVLGWTFYRRSLFTSSLQVRTLVEIFLKRRWMVGVFQSLPKYKKLLTDCLMLYKRVWPLLRPVGKGHWQRSNQFKAHIFYTTKKVIKIPVLLFPFRDPLCTDYHGNWQMLLIRGTLFGTQACGLLKLLLNQALPTSYTSLSNDEKVGLY